MFDPIADVPRAGGGEHRALHEPGVAAGPRLSPAGQETI